MHKTLSKITIFILVVFGITTCSYFQKPIQQASPIARILIYKGSTIKLKPRDSYIFLFNSRKEVGRGNITVTMASNGITINGTKTSLTKIEVVPSEYFEFNGHRFRGNARIINNGKYLMLINIIDIESYLYGVLPAEVPVSWNYEALKAQAVASRTYALYEIASSRKRKRLYDLHADTSSQMYTGIDGENKFTSAAVNTTIGEVIKYQKKIIKSYFHACSGGVTESAEEMFGEKRNYLTPVKSPFGKIYKNYKWQTEISLQKLQRHINGKASDTNPIVAVNVTKRTASKRIKSIDIVEANGGKVALTGNELRMLIGATIMKSTRANIKVYAGKLLVQGVGYGHGVGMGQWDAQGMAQKGFKYNSIISYFYKGTSIDKIW